MAWEDTLKDLREQYVRGAAERLSNIERTIDLLEVQPSDESALKDLRRYFHGLSGSGKTYGFAQVTEIGLWGEQDCDTLLKSEQIPSSENVGRWRGLLRELRKEFGGGAHGFAEIEELPPVYHQPFEILVVDDDNDVCSALSHFLVEEGMHVRIARTKEEAIREAERQMPDGMVVDVMLPDGSGYHVVEQVRKLPAGEIPAIIVISALSGFFDKVESISSGSDGFFEKPVDWEVLVQRLRYLLLRDRAEPPRILSVEDDSDQAAFLRAVLQSAGYKVRICTDPKQFEADLISFRPDLVIMDIVLPEVTGHDLARYLRQNEQYATMPVLFLSTKGQMNDKIETVRAGGDDHLVKPVPPGLLLSTVAARIERSRFLRSLLDRDGLTKLLTHTAFVERARAVVGQLSRNPERSPALVLLDLDHFKKINDTYGHTTGDRVLASLAALLRRRLRQTDTIGRYGGEEFAILIDDLKKEEAIRLISRLLQEFETMNHSAPEGKIFHVSFSAGIAMLDPTMTLSNWVEAADKALYAAKEQGRRLVKAF